MEVFQLTDTESVTVRESASSSGGTLLEMEAVWGPVAHRPPLHFHPSQAEHFEVLEGELTAEIDGRRRVVTSGESFDVPAGTRHKMWNSGSGQARAVWQVRPALRSEEFFRSMHASRAHRRSSKGGTATTLGGARVLNAFRDEFRLTIPGPVQGPVIALLAALARLRGYPAP